MHARRIAVLAFVVDVSLFVLKFCAGIASMSLAVMADALNSLLDALGGIGVLGSVAISHKRADKGHAFASGRAEPMVAFVIALLTGIVAFELLRAALTGLVFMPLAPTLTWAIAATLIVAIIAKILLSYESGRAGEQANSPSLRAIASDARNDVLITLSAIAGLAFAASGLLWVDCVVALLISLFLFRESYLIAKRTIGYVVGETPPSEVQHRIRTIASTVLGVRGIHSIRVHYVGTFAHVAIHLLVDPQASPAARHAIAAMVQHEVEQLPPVSKAFVHVDHH